MIRTDMKIGFWVTCAALSAAAHGAITTRNWTTTTPDGNTGNWSDATKWSGGSVPDTTGVNGESATFGAYAENRTITVDGTNTVYTINKLSITPRTSGYSARTFTMNASGGSSLSLETGLDIDNGALVTFNVPIEVTANQTWSGLSSSPAGNALFSQAISGAGRITRTAGNTSYFIFAGANTFTGGFVNSAQTTVLGTSSDAALTSGPLGTGTVQLNGGTLTARSNVARTLHNNVEVGGNVTLGSTFNTFPFDLRGDLVFAPASTPTTFNLSSATNNVARTITTGSGVTINQSIGETGGGTGLGLTKAGTATLTLGGSASNTYSGLTTVNAGTLDLNKTGGATAIAGNLAIGDGSGTDTVRLLASDQIADTSVVTLGSGAVLNLNNLSDTIGSLRGVGTAQSGTGVLTVATQLAPGASAGTLTVTNTTGASGEFVLASTASLAYELLGTDQTVGAGVNDLTTVTGDLTLDGTLNVTELVAGSFLSAADGDMWRLFDYTGVLTDNGLALGSMPSLAPGLSFDVDTTVAGQVNLVVVPEPVSLALLGSALAMGLRRRRN